MKTRTILKTSARAALAFVLAAALFSASALAATQPLEFSAKPSFPQTLGSGKQFTLQYTLQNHTPVSLPLRVSTSVSAGTLILSSHGNTCGTLLAGGQSCVLPLIFTAPTVNANQSQTVTGRISIDYQGRYPLLDNSIQFNVKSTVPGHFQFQHQGQVITSLTLSHLDAGTVEIHNTGESAITHLHVTIPAGLTGFSNTTCADGSTLAPNASCTLTYISPAAALAGVYTLTVTGTGADNSPASLPVTVDVPGHFQFQHQGQAIETLDLQHTDAGTVEIDNAGGSAITNLHVTIPAGLTGFVGSTCIDGSTLAVHASCTLTYISPAAALAGTYILTVTGTGADNSPASLPVMVDVPGHFQFRHQGQAIETLDLQRTDAGTVEIRNAGGSDITNLLVDISPGLTGFANTTCADGSTLAPNASCTLTYTSPAATLSGAYTLTATGAGADNSPASLPVDVDVPGHFQFRHQGQAIETLDLQHTDAGTVEIRNTGGSDISNLHVTIPAGLTGFTNTSCTDGSTLAVNASCTLTYISPAATLSDTYTLTVTGTGADNSPASLPITVDVPGHFQFQHQGQTIAWLGLLSSDAGTVEILNAGGSDITNLQVDIPAGLTGFTNTTCADGSTLAVNASCTLTYISPAADIPGVYTLTVTGANADNSPASLPVDVDEVSIHLNTEPANIHAQYRRIDVVNDTAQAETYEGADLTANLTDKVHVCAVDEDEDCETPFLSTCTPGQGLAAGGGSCFLWVRSLETTTSGSVNGSLTVETSRNNRTFPITYHMDLIAAGTFTTAGGTAANRIARWDGTAWAALGGGMNNTINSLASYHGDVIAGGTFASPATNIARWNGTAWQPLGSGVNNGAETAILYNGELIVGGRFTSAGGVAGTARIARWDGTEWLALAGGGMTGVGSPAVWALTTYDGQVIAGGEFTFAGGTSATRIARWNGIAWQSLGSGMNDTVIDLTSYNGELIAGGFFTTAGGTAANHIARWNGTSWQSLGSGTNAIVGTLTTYNGELIAGGLFSSPATRIARWNGAAWAGLGSGMNSTVQSLTTYNGELIAGGHFTLAGGTSANRIARWNGTAWAAFGTGMNNTVTALLAFASITMSED